MEEHVFSAGGSRRKELIFLIQGRSKTSKACGLYITSLLICVTEEEQNQGASKLK